ncbi:MAG: Rrf2 family transcriptional regulator [Bacteroidales bacterium]|nr:Rrf2 family transcriptional regulator [Bacteroidales bacterium]
MKFSTKTRYGIRAMQEIGKYSLESKPIFQKEIAKKQGISVKYLDHIISGLKSAGLVVNIRGKKSGYKLTRNPSEITLLDIHNAFEPGICVIDCLAEGVECSYDDNCAAQGFWGGLNNIVVEYFQSFTLQDLIDKQHLIDDDVASKVSR